MRHLLVCAKMFENLDMRKKSHPSIDSCQRLRAGDKLEFPPLRIPDRNLGTIRIRHYIKPYIHRIVVSTISQ